MRIAAFVFDDITPLDIVGPVQVLGMLPGAEVIWVARRRGPVRDPRTGVVLQAERALDEVGEAEILLLPGGTGTRALVRDRDVLDWIRRMHATSLWTASVCTGSLLLGAAGLLAGLTATTHWNAKGILESFGATYVEERVVRHGRIIMAAGVSAGIDMALTLAGLIAGDDIAQQIQLMIEYDPQPPYQAGAPAKAPPAVVEGLRSALAAAGAGRDRG